MDQIDQNEDQAEEEMDIDKDEIDLDKYAILEALAEEEYQGKDPGDL